VTTWKIKKEMGG